MGVLVDMSTGEFLETGCFGNLCEYVHGLDCAGIAHTYRVFFEDDAYCEVA
jgi:hypothetical protein